MRGDHGQMQQLTDEQVRNRLAAYNPGGSLERDMRQLWDDAGDIIEAEVRAQFGAEASAKAEAQYTGKVDAKWVQAVADAGRQI